MIIDYAESVDGNGNAALRALHQCCGSLSVLTCVAQFESFKLPSYREQAELTSMTVITATSIVFNKKTVLCRLIF